MIKAVGVHLVVTREGQEPDEEVHTAHAYRCGLWEALGWLGLGATILVALVGLSVALWLR